MDKWQKAAQILESGGVMIIPSDSSYGIAALASSNQAVEKLYQIKKREAGKPSLVIVGSLDQARELVEFTPLAEKLANKYWPGGLTLVLKARKIDLSSLVYGENQSLAIRIPNKKQLQDLATQIGPFILPSANFNAEKPPFSASEVDPKLISQVDSFLDEPTDGNMVSTLVDARGDQPIILREGAVKLSQYP